MSKECGIKITVITVTYNCEKLIGKTIKSVLSQTYSNIEYIIVDGLSNDTTMKIVNEYRNKIAVVISEKDRGISDAFNKGIKYASGELIMFLNAGDFFCDDSILSKVASDWSNCKTDVLFYKVSVGDHTFIPADSYRDNEEKIWNDCQVPHQGAFVRKKLFEDIGMFNTFMKIRMDYDFFARCKKADCTYKYISETIVSYEIGGTSMQTDNAVRFYKEGLAVKLLYGMRIQACDLIYMLMPNWLRNMGKKVIRR